MTAVKTAVVDVRTALMHAIGPFIRNLDATPVPDIRSIQLPTAVDRKDGEIKWDIKGRFEPAERMFRLQHPLDSLSLPVGDGGDLVSIALLQAYAVVLDHSAVLFANKDARFRKFCESQPTLAQSVASVSVWGPKMVPEVGAVASLHKTFWSGFATITQLANMLVAKLPQGCSDPTALLADLSKRNLIDSFTGDLPPYFTGPITRAGLRPSEPWLTGRSETLDIAPGIRTWTRSLVEEWRKEAPSYRTNPGELASGMGCILAHQRLSDAEEGARLRDRPFVLDEASRAFLRLTLNIYHQISTINGVPHCGEKPVRFCPLGKSPPNRSEKFSVWPCSPPVVIRPFGSRYRTW